MKTWTGITLALIALTVSACSGNRSPQTIAANTAHNGTILVQSVDEVQKFVIAQEAAGAIPRNTAVTIMEGIGRGLKAARSASGYLDRLASLPTGSSETGPLVGQIQDALALINKDVVGLVVPGANDAVKQQIATLVAEVNRAITAVQDQIARYKGGK